MLPGAIHRPPPTAAAVCQIIRQHMSYVAGERPMLVWLEFRGQTLLGTCSGLTAALLQQ